MIDGKLELTMPTIDLIGDIHGNADKLRALLSRLGYEQSGGVYGSPDRRAIFVGDLIDRGPAIGEVIEIVAGMLRAGSAQIVMGTTNSTRSVIIHGMGRETICVLILPRMRANMRRRSSIS